VDLIIVLSRYPIFAQISGNMLVWLESREQLLSQHRPSSCRANPAKVLKAALDYIVSILSLIWPKFIGRTIVMLLYSGIIT